MRQHAAIAFLLTLAPAAAAERLVDVPRECAGLAAQAGFPLKLTALQARAARAKLAMQDQNDPEIRRCNAALNRTEGKK